MQCDRPSIAVRRDTDRRAVWLFQNHRAAWLSLLCMIGLALSVATRCAADDEASTSDVSVLVGQLSQAESGTASSPNSPLTRPFGVDFMPDGSMIIVELEGGRVHRCLPSGELEQIAGDGSKSYGGDGQTAAGATFNGMHNVAVTPDGSIYIADSWNHCIRRIDPVSNIISTVAGTGKAGFSGDGGPGTKAAFNFIMCITLNPQNNAIYIADLNNRRIRRFDLTTGIVTTVAGNGKQGVPADGNIARNAPLVDPRAVTVDRSGAIYILERSGHALRKVSPDGHISTVAGTGTAGFRDGPALASQLNSPKHVCVDGDDNVFIADDQNRAIRRYDPHTATVTTVLGRGFGNERIELSHPHGVCVERDRLIVVDTGNDRIFGMPLTDSRGNARRDKPKRPNIVWIVVEDMSRPFGCYGETVIKTPNVDRLAERGTRFTNAFVTAPVCSAARSALITGRYQTSIGAHQHRSGRGIEKIPLPADVPLVPQLFRRAGYFAANAGRIGQPARARRNSNAAPPIGKTDYNFEWDAAAYDGSHWNQRKPEQPFFVQFQLAGGKGRTKNTPMPIDSAAVRLPPYYPDDPVIREDWAEYLNAAMNTDRQVGTIVRELEDAGELENTCIFFITDHGISHARGKQFLYEEGICIPLIVAGPGIPSGAVRDDLAVHIDLAATSLTLAGIPVPKNMQSVDLFDETLPPRPFVVAARDRCDETVDRIRCVRTDRYKYIRNFHHERPYLQPNAYKDNKPIIQRMRERFAAGQLNAAQSLIMADHRPPEELYDLQSDPWELHNLADQPDRHSTLIELRGTLDRWMIDSNDLGRTPESAAMYDSDMQVYLDGMRRKKPARFDEIQSNINLMKRWQREGK